MIDKRTIQRNAIRTIALSGILLFSWPGFLSAQSLNGWSLLWSDEFNGTSLDAGKWGLELNEGDPGIAVYTNRSQNLFVQNGCLVLQAMKESYNGRQYTSTQISSRNKGSWRFGRIDVRAKLPLGKGFWPAIWMMPNNPAYGGWPASGEIDIMEAIGANLMYTTLHFGTNNSSKAGTYRPVNAPLDSFHVYTMVWDSGSFKFYLDTVNFWNCSQWAPNNTSYPAPFDKAFFLMFDLAIGGSWAGPPDSTSVFPSQMLVDWVRVYQRATATAPSRPAACRARDDGFSMRVEGKTLAYKLGAATDARIELCTMAGQRITPLVDKYQPAGRYRIGLPVDGLQNGVYLCTFDNGRIRESRKFCVAK